MGDIIYIEEWQENKKVENMWSELSSRGYDIRPLQKLWAEGEIYFMTHSNSFPVTVIETVSPQQLEEGDFTLE